MSSKERMIDFGVAKIEQDLIEKLELINRDYRQIIQACSVLPKRKEKVDNIGLYLGAEDDSKFVC